MNGQIPPFRFFPEFPATFLALGMALLSYGRICLFALGPFLFLFFAASVAPLYLMPV